EISLHESSSNFTRTCDPSSPPAMAVSAINKRQDRCCGSFKLLIGLVVDRLSYRKGRTHQAGRFVPIPVPTGSNPSRLVSSGPTPLNDRRPPVWPCPPAARAVHGFDRRRPP